MLKELMKSIGKYKKETILAPVLITFEVLLEIIIPILTADLIDYGINQGNMPYVVKIGVILIIASIFSMFFGIAAGKTAAIASAGFAKNLRRNIYDNVQKFSFSNIDKFSTSSIVTRLTTDVVNLQMAFQMIIRTAIRSPFMLIFSFIVSCKIDMKLSMIFLVTIPILALGLLFIMTHAHPIFMRVFKRYDKLNSVVQENLHGIRVVKSFTREDYETDKFDNISKEIYDDFTKAEKLLAFNAPLMQFCMYSCMILISWFGAKAIIACGGDPVLGLSTGELMSLIVYAMQILSSLMMVSMIFVMITISKASAERIYEILTEESDIKSPENPVTTVKDGSVEFENVTFSYGKHADKNCLDNVNVSIKSGETVGILGGTGSSKSTLVQLIPRLYDTASGRVTVGGVDVREYDLDILRNSVAMVLQKNELFSGTIAENLRWGNEHATDEELISACKLAAADEFINRFPDGYNTHIEQGGANVSGGQKQRICIARAILKKPAILILDDSTSAVDTKTDANIRKALKTELPNTTKIIIAQRVSSVEDADKIIIMDNGKISDIGKHEELLSRSEIYREVYESQQKGGSDNE